MGRSGWVPVRIRSNALGRGTTAIEFRQREGGLNASRMPKQTPQRTPPLGEKPAKRRGRPTLREQQDRADTREFLIQAASELMIAKGGVTISLSEIAGRTQLSPAVVRYYFGDKDGLLLALLEREAKTIGGLRALAEEDLPAAIKLRLHIGGLVDAIFRAPYLNQLLRMMQQEGGAKASRVTELFIRPISEFQKILLEQGQREGVFREVSPIEFYFTINGACALFFNDRETLRDVFGVSTISEELKTNFARSLTSIVLKGVEKR
jgi:TetR/AcrR family transcriptional regulator